MRPLTLTADMALAAILGPKTETRRPLNPQPPAGMNFVDLLDGSKDERFYAWTEECDRLPNAPTWKAPFGLPGTELWLREPGRIAELAYSDGSVPLLTIEYLTDKARRVVPLPDRLGLEDLGRDPSWLKVGHGIPNGIFREAARFKTVVINVRVERLQDISSYGAAAEGFDNMPGEDRIRFGEVDCYGTRRVNYAMRGFIRTWDRIYGKRPGLSWADNPWVSVTAWDRMVAI